MVLSVWNADQHSIMTTPEKNIQNTITTTRCLSCCTSDSIWFHKNLPKANVNVWDYIAIRWYKWIKNSSLKQDMSTMEVEKQDAGCITWCFNFLSSFRDAALVVENHQRTTTTHACKGGGGSCPQAVFSQFQHFEHLKAYYFHKYRNQNPEKKVQVDD